MKIQLIRNATLRLSYAGKMILIDPMLTDKHVIRSFAGISKNPTVDLPFPPEDVLKDIDCLVVSHLHPDHFDPLAQEMLSKDVVLFCQPENKADIAAAGFQCLTAIETEIKWEGITITRIPGQHGFGKMADRMGPVSGFVFQAEGEPTLYWLGDTVWVEPVQAALNRFKPDVVVTHSGGAQFKPTMPPIIMDIEQTLAVCAAAPQADVVATHLESLDHCPVTRSMLALAADEAGVSARFHIPADGGSVEFA